MSLNLRSPLNPCPPLYTERLEQCLGTWPVYGGHSSNRKSCLRRISLDRGWSEVLEPSGLLASSTDTRLAVVRTYLTLGQSLREC